LIVKLNLYSSDVPVVKNKLKTVGLLFKNNFLIKTYSRQFQYAVSSMIRSKEDCTPLEILENLNKKIDEPHRNRVSDNISELPQLILANYR